MTSRNKREGYYAGKYRDEIVVVEGDDAKNIFGKPRHHRWDAWAMSEFYPPIRGSIWKMLDEGKI